MPCFSSFSEILDNSLYVDSDWYSYYIWLHVYWKRKASLLDVWILHIQICMIIFCTNGCLHWLVTGCEYSLSVVGGWSLLVSLSVVL